MSTLDRYLEERDEQSSREEKELQLEENPVLKEIIDIYESWVDDFGHLSMYNNYKAALNLVSEIEYTSSDVQSFSLAMKDYELLSAEGYKKQEYALGGWFQNSGVFLSALVNAGDDEEYTLVTEHLESRLHYLGFFNIKNLSIKGDAGYWLGRNMSKGSLTLTGDAEGGCGYFFEGGELTVHGNVKRGTLGACMRGGVIRVDGDIYGISNRWKRGRIYEGGELVRCTRLGRIFDWLRGENQ